ncbi:hypothetical protein Tco_0489865 [Tanacetum coccineum]
MHNNIMAAGSKDRPPMLGPGRYSQWHSRFLRYLDTKSNGEYLRKCIFDGPYMPTNVLIAAVEAAENILPVAAHEEAETIHNMTAENKLYFQAEKEAIFLILTGIGDEIYSTVDACNTAKEMWTAIERLQQGESLNVQDVKTNLFWEFGKFTSRDGESMESYYSRFYKLMNELTRNNLQREEIDKVSYHRLFDLLKQFQNEVNDIRSERLARSANPLALLAAAQPYSDNYYQAPKPQRSNAPSYMQSSSTRPRMRKPKTGLETHVHRKDVAVKQAAKGVPTSSRAIRLASRHGEEIDNNSGSTLHYMSKIHGRFSNADSGTDSEPVEQVQYDTDDNVFANDIQHFDQSESISNTCAVETDDSNVTPDSPDMCDNDIQDDQNDFDVIDERVFCTC